MRKSREAKAETHAAIVAEASRLFRERGIEKTSVGDVMKAAKRTHGGFYRHFDSKDDLLSAAMQGAFSDMADMVTARFEEITEPRARRAAFSDYYLSDDHLAGIADGCPAAALSGDVARSTAAHKAAFGAGVRAIVDALAEAMEGSDSEKRAAAARSFAQQLGAVAIARASDPDTAKFILSACRDSESIDPA